MDYVVHYVRQHDNENGIIYCATRKDVDRVYENLTRAGIKVGHYHGGLSDEVRREMQNAYADDKLQVMVATNAFGDGHRQEVMCAMCCITRCRATWSPTIKRPGVQVAMGLRQNVSCSTVGRMYRFINI